jgi:hypothetical protein
VGWGILLQLVFAFLVLYWQPGSRFFLKLNDVFNALLFFSKQGTMFVFGSLGTADKGDFPISLQEYLTRLGAQSSDPAIQNAIRTGNVWGLPVNLLLFSLVAGVLGLVATWIARGLARLAQDRPASRLVRHEPWIGAGIVAIGGATAAILTAIDRPAAMAGLLWRRGGIARAAQLGLERTLSPTPLAAAAVLAAVTLAGFSFAGWWRSSSRGGRRAALITVSSMALVVPILIFAPRLRRGFHHAADPERPNVLLVVVASIVGVLNVLTLMAKSALYQEVRCASVQSLMKLSWHEAHFMLMPKNACEMFWENWTSIVWLALTVPRHLMPWMKPSESAVGEISSRTIWS